MSTSTIQIINLTPHPVTIHRPGREPVTYPACAPTELPRAIEGTAYPAGLDGGSSLPGPQSIGIGDMALSDSGSDGQGGYERSVMLASSGLVDFTGYVGVDGLGEPLPGERMFGTTRFFIVSVVTAIGAAVSGRGIEDLLVPMGQVRGPDGRIVGAAALAPATSLLTPLYRRWTSPLTTETIKALQQRNELARIVRLDASSGCLPAWARDLGHDAQ